MDDVKVRDCKIIGCIILAIAIALAGYFVGNAFFKGKLLDRTVTVKGSAEMEVDSDLAVWPLYITATGDDLLEINNKIEKDRKIISEFLIVQGFKAAEITMGEYDLDDALASNHRAAVDYKDNRYTIRASIIIKTNNIKLIDLVSKSKNLLVQKGVVLGATDYNQDNSPHYEFTKFNDVKPQMLSDAIKNARISAERFANDSGSKVGKLKSANQGVFLVSTADNQYPDHQSAKAIRKKIRVVTTLEYFLE